VIRQAAEIRGSLSVQRMCELVGVSRSSYYRQAVRREPRPAEPGVQQELHNIADRSRRYGYRRMTRELHHRGWKINHKRVLQLMREQKLLCRRRARWIRTTDSGHGLAIYPNLARKREISGLNQLWVADISYLRLSAGWAYLAVILDAFSRRVIGWAVGLTLEARLPLAALRMALRQRQFQPGLIHHSDRGVQYACQAYVKQLRAQGILSSMSRPGNPYDNAIAESFFKTLKMEEAYYCEYSDIGHARRRLRNFIDFYNRQRLHSALRYQSPADFEAALTNAGNPAELSGSAE
jgi:putative transposase